MKPFPLLIDANHNQEYQSLEQECVLLMKWHHFERDNDSWFTSDPLIQTVIPSDEVKRIKRCSVGRGFDHR